MLYTVRPGDGLADDVLVQRVNHAIATGRQRNRGGLPVEKPLDGGLVRSDREVLYPIVDGIPILLVAEAIPRRSLIDDRNEWLALIGSPAACRRTSG